MNTESSAPLLPEQALSSWKDIAKYLCRDVRTVQRWERSRGLPVHRLPGNGKHAIYAFKSELDRWWADAPRQREQFELVAAPAPPHRRWVYLVGAGVAAATTLGLLAWLLLKLAAA